MRNKNLTLLKILLIAIMVFQPAVSADAMTAMDHSQNGVASKAMSEHKMDHGAMHQAMNEDAFPVSMEDCCASNATCSMMSCSVALPQNPISIAIVTTSLVTPAYQISWVGILQPTEIRPPRNTLS
ncbi:hypothetical protein MNBD_GAMMA26-1779 [hydrothermal vent metagenome]|uniref:Uncharacterized protein n=1 Tax=hydrothermal vent metagenome TaxID=652676 RepID=A0A3B1AY06_9ZZZZ